MANQQAGAVLHSIQMGWLPNGEGAGPVRKTSHLKAAAEMGAR